MIGESQNGTRNILFVKFPKEDIYFVRYTIAGDDEIPTRGVFALYVRKDIKVNKPEVKSLELPESMQEIDEGENVTGGEE